MVSSAKITRVVVDFLISILLMDYNEFASDAEETIYGDGAGAGRIRTRGRGGFKTVRLPSFVTITRLPSGIVIICDPSGRSRITTPPGRTLFPCRRGWVGSKSG